MWSSSICKLCYLNRDRRNTYCRSDWVVATVEVTELNRKSGRGTASMEVCGMEPTTVDAAASKVAVESSQNWNSLLVALVADWERHMLKYIHFLRWCDSGGKVTVWLWRRVYDREGCLPYILLQCTFTYVAVYLKALEFHVQYLADVFWRQWIRAYLPSLQQRQKWNHATRNLQLATSRSCCTRKHTEVPGRLGVSRKLFQIRMMVWWGRSDFAPNISYFAPCRKLR